MHYPILEDQLTGHAMAANTVCDCLSRIACQWRVHAADPTRSIHDIWEGDRKCGQMGPRGETLVIWIVEFAIVDWEC